MRVIAGSARSLPLKTLEGMDTRPTTDRIKETLFNMIQSEIPGCRFLDLYAGSGAIAIEALSRGAKEAVLVENVRLSGQEVFDIVYMDPPYAKDYERGALETLAAGSIIDGYTTIIIEEKLDTDLSYVQDLGYTITKTKTYKTNKHVFLKKEGK